MLPEQGIFNVVIDALHTLGRGDGSVGAVAQ
jgi:hypothetical protein